MTCTRLCLLLMVSMLPVRLAEFNEVFRLKLACPREQSLFTLKVSTKCEPQVRNGQHVYSVPLFVSHRSASPACTAS